MKNTLFSLLMLVSASGFAQKNEKISTIDFVEILNDNSEEALFYYKNNWLELRKAAKKDKSIHSYEIIETTYSEEAPFHLVLITTYVNQAQFEVREEKFGALIKASGGLKLLNEKQPGDFRKVIFSKEASEHLY